MSTSFLTILLFFTFIDSILSQFMVGESTRTNCHDLCHSAGYICESEIFGSFSCSVAAQTYCKDPFVREQHTYDPRQLTCYTGGGCFVNCNENSYLELHRINGTCGINNCEIGEFSYRIICPCIPKPTPPPEYEITMTETEEIGTLSLVSLSICGILWLLCCSCSTDVIRRSYYSEYGTEEELESFMKQEVGIQTQALWFLWCDPLKRSCWSCFQEVKRYIYRCCCKSRKLNENDSPKSISSSSHPLNEPNSDSNQHDLNAKIDEESQVKSPTVAPPPSFPRTVNSPLSSDINPSKHTQAPSSTSTKFPQQRMPIPFYRDESRGLQNSSNVFQSSASQRFSTSSRSMTRPEYNPIYSSSTPSNPSHTPFPSTVELGSLRPLPTPSPAISHTNDSLTPIKAPLSELYGSHSSKLYSKPLDDSQTS